MVAKKAVSKKSVSSKPASPKPMKKDSNSKTKGPASVSQENIKYYDSMLDSAGDILDYPTGHKLHKQAAALLNKYNYASNTRTQVAPGSNPYAGVSGRTANALSRDYNKLMSAVDSYEASVKARAPMGKKPSTPPKKK